MTAPKTDSLQPDSLQPDLPDGAGVPAAEDSASVEAAPPQPPRRRSASRRWVARVSGAVTGVVAVAGALLLLVGKPQQELEPSSAHAAAPAATEARPPAVTVVHATRGPITETAVLTGNLVPRDEILVSPQVDGLAIEQILVEEGDTVGEGQVLARLSRAMIETSLAQNAAQIARADAAIAQAQSTIAEAQASKDQAASAFARSQSLRKDGIATADTLEQRQASSKAAAARLDAAQHALTVAQADRTLADAQRSEMMVRSARTEIRAPAAGLVSRRTARVGAIASAGGEPLFRIIKDNAVELQADVPEATLASLQPGMTAQVKTAARKQAFTAHVRLVAPEVDQATRLGRVRLALDPAPGQTIGSFGRALVQVDSHDGVLLPQSAVLYTDGGASVQVVKDDVVRTQAVGLGLRTADQVEIANGVAAGDAVVATAGTFVRDGDKVSPVGPKS